MRSNCCTSLSYRRHVSTGLATDQRRHARFSLLIAFWALSLLSPSRPVTRPKGIVTVPDASSRSSICKQSSLVLTTIHMVIREIIPDPEVLLAMEVEELAGVLLLHLNSGAGTLHHYNFFVGLNSQPVYGAVNRNRDARVNRALMEAWDWPPISDSGPETAVRQRRGAFRRVCSHSEETRHINQPSPV